jgi:hypothetical protein
VYAEPQAGMCASPELLHQLEEASHVTRCKGLPEQLATYTQNTHLLVMNHQYRTDFELP